MERDTRFWRGAIEALEEALNDGVMTDPRNGDPSDGESWRVPSVDIRRRIERIQSLLAAAEAREATKPTAAEVIEAAGRALKRVVGLDYMGDPDVAIHSFPNLKVTPMQAAEELYELRSLIARYKEAHGG